jgi:putative endonuclease
MSEAKDWFVYLIRTNTSSLYCGITNDLQRRLKQHQSGTGAKALRGKSPLSLVWFQGVSSKSEALKIEVAIKKLTKTRKESLVESNSLFILPNNVRPPS